MGDTALNHFVTPFVARHDERGDNTATKAKRAERHGDDELQQLTHRNNPGSLAMFAAIRRAASRVSNLGKLPTPLNSKIFVFLRAALGAIAVGIDYQALRFLLSARRDGVSFERSLMLGRQNYYFLSLKQAKRIFRQFPDPPPKGEIARMLGAPLPRCRVMVPLSTSHRCTADSTSVCSTVCKSNAERLMTLRTSAVAVCCCNESRSSPRSRAFSMAITAYGKVLH